MKFFIKKSIPYNKYYKISEYFRKKRWENIIFCEHPPVITAGIQFKQESFRIPIEALKSKNIDVFFLKRGGDLTAHEHGQIIIYPHIDLKKRKLSLSDFVQFCIDNTKNILNYVFELNLIYEKDMPGLYTGEKQKVVSIGFEIRKAFTTSGIAINYKNNLSTFQYIYPCGYKELEMKTIQQLTNLNSIELEKKQQIFIEKWINNFQQFLYQKTVRK